MWCVPKLDPQYIARMENILDLYQKPLDSSEPVICLDEKSLQLLKDKYPISRIPQKGKVQKVDYEYKRRGTCNAFCVVEPKRGLHYVKITKTRKAKDFAEVLREIGRIYQRADTIHLVMDNLNTHSKKALTRNLGPKRGENLWNRFTVHYTPKHASWLNQAETEISMFTRECIGGDRIATLTTLKKRSESWVKDANKRRRTIKWAFTSKKAKEKFNY